MTEPLPGQVTRAGSWAIANRNGDLVGVSLRCRHQLADLSQGSVDDEGCLVCPWHQSRYDLDTGQMVAGPRGFLSYHGAIPGYSALIRLVGHVVPLRLRNVVMSNGRLSVGTRRRSDS